MFSITDPENRKNFCLRETTFSTDSDMITNIQRIIFDLNFLTQQYKQTNVIFVSPGYDFVPAAFFENKEKQRLYNTVHADKSECILTNESEKQGLVTIYSVEERLHNFLLRNLCDPLFYHYTNLLADVLRDKGKAISLVSKMFVNFHDNLMDIICFSRSQFLHCLTFENEPVDNQLYFILKVWEQCGFDQLKDHLYIIGNPDEQMRLNLYNYIKNIEPMSAPSETFLWNEDASKAPLDLLSLSL